MKRILSLPLLALVPIPGPLELADLGFLVLLAGLCSSLTYVLYFRLIAEVGASISCMPGPPFGPS